MFVPPWCYATANAVLTCSQLSRTGSRLYRSHISRQNTCWKALNDIYQIPKDLDSFKALILSGSPYSVREADSPRINLEILLSKFPTLAVCYGAQLIAQEMGGVVSASNIRE